MIPFIGLKVQYRALEPQIRQRIEAVLEHGNYPKPLHLQTAHAGLGYRQGDMPVSADCARRIFSLPMHPYLEQADQERIVAAVRALV